MNRLNMTSFENYFLNLWHCKRGSVVHVKSVSWFRYVHFRIKVCIFHLFSQLWLKTGVSNQGVRNQGFGEYCSISFFWICRIWRPWLIFLIMKSIKIPWPFLELFAYWQDTTKTIFILQNPDILLNYLFIKGYFRLFIQ